LAIELTDEQFDRLTRNFPLPRNQGCPTCGGSKRYRLDGESHECNCDNQRALARRYFAANIPRRFHQLDGTDFVEEYRRLNAGVVEAVDSYVTKFPYNYHYGLGLCFYGPLGTGKTLLATHILKQTLRFGYSGYFIQFKDLFHAWAAAWKDNEAKEEVEVFMKRADVLVLDEIRSDKRNETGYLQDGLEAIMRHRYNNNLPTILTTNMQEEDLQKEFYRPYSLISGVTSWLTMEGADFRPVSYENANYLVANEETLPVK
jgi:DNA replication protein DnaC